MSYLTVLNDKGYQEYIDDVARGLEAEEQRKLALERDLQQTPQISLGKILLICITIIISTALIFVAIAICLRDETEEASQSATIIEEALPEQKQTLWNCNGKYTNSPTDESNCTMVSAEDTVDSDGTRSITPNAPKK